MLDGPCRTILTAIICSFQIKLDVGGHLYTTSILTLTKDPDSMLAVMFSGRHSLVQEQDGSYFLDRDGTHFRYILNFLRDGGFKEGKGINGAPNLPLEDQSDPTFNRVLGKYVEWGTFPLAHWTRARKFAGNSF